MNQKCYIESEIMKYNVYIYMQNVQKYKICVSDMFENPRYDLSSLDDVLLTITICVSLSISNHFLTNNLVHI